MNSMLELKLVYDIECSLVRWTCNQWMFVVDELQASYIFRAFVVQVFIHIV